MKKSYKHKLIVGLALTTLAGTSAISLSAPAFLDNVTVAHADSQAISDNTSNRSITLTKYAIQNEGQLGAPGDGTKWDNPDNLATLKNVKFKLVRVKALDGGQPLVDTTTAVEGTDYKIDTDFTPMEAATDADGQFTFDLGKGKANDGIYMLVEEDSTGVINNTTGAATTIKYKAIPAFIYVPMTNRQTQSGLIYDVNVYPKNEEDTPLNPVKTIDGTNGESLVAGQVYEWDAAFDINPSDIFYTATEDSFIEGLDPNTDYTEPGSTGGHVHKGDKVYMDYLKVSDNLNPNQNLLSVDMQVKDKDNNWISLEQDKDYTFLDGANEMKPAGKNTVQLTQSGMEKVGKMTGATQMRVVYKAQVNEGWDGEIKNTFSVDDKSPGLKPDHDTNPDIPKYYDGGFDLHKVDENGDNLSGAEFYIATSEENARAGKYLASDDKSYAEGTDLPEGVHFLTTTSDAQGHANFDGLPLTWYEDVNGNGKQDMDGTEPTFADADIQRDYWVVETKAPSGYELVKDPIKVTVNLNTASDTSWEATIENKKQSDLPFTGAKGTTLMVSIAIGAIALGTAAVVIDKKRRQA
ncbi:SpaH/EbpB family LPXTG-anchored major pilin [Lactococcus garvieae]|uniref:SpaH/EbpB family LPXTG-anchored major pilin n=1 Tax=Lactococcus garvieae TaxID=1363 RepID=UPI0009BE8A60|nr:SpaH/EbpB family LPXTG-anchored major pilin [Lactococcus garvieae]